MAKTEITENKMPQIGEVRRGNKGYYKHIWLACNNCGKERWVSLHKKPPVSGLCYSCVLRGRRSRGWKGGTYKTDNGYRMIWLSPDDFFYPMAKKQGYVLEHRLVMAKKLGRCLLKGEVVHHRPDVARDDNREEVLYLMPNASDHSRLLPCSNCELKKEIRLLRLQIRNLQEALQEKLHI